jgi:hypothetical protein
MPNIMRPSVGLEYRTGGWGGGMGRRGVWIGRLDLWQREEDTRSICSERKPCADDAQA